ncbi:hypothetical protein C8R45DRAFT_942800 [Mycena sanguinolenta]|nr:hypothetical protein C8R45DRAFT_942800 [Mycena sanguinolenta]
MSAICHHAVSHLANQRGAFAIHTIVSHAKREKLGKSKGKQKPAHSPTPRRQNRVTKKRAMAEKKDYEQRTKRKRSEWRKGKQREEREPRPSIIQDAANRRRGRAGCTWRRRRLFGGLRETQMTRDGMRRGERNGAARRRRVALPNTTTRHEKRGTRRSGKREKGKDKGANTMRRLELVVLHACAGDEYSRVMFLPRILVVHHRRLRFVVVEEGGDVSTARACTVAAAARHGIIAIDGRRARAGGSGGVRRWVCAQSREQSFASRRRENDPGDIGAKRETRTVQRGRLSVGWMQVCRDTGSQRHENNGRNERDKNYTGGKNRDEEGNGKNSTATKHEERGDISLVRTTKRVEGAVGTTRSATVSSTG